MTSDIKQSTPRPARAIPFLDEAEEREFQAALESVGSKGSAQGFLEVKPNLPSQNATITSSSRTLAPKAVLAALSIPPRRSYPMPEYSDKDGLPSISVSELERYSMTEERTPLAFSFNLSQSGLVSPTSLGANPQAAAPSACSKSTRMARGA